MIIWTVFWSVNVYPLYSGAPFLWNFLFLRQILESAPFMSGNYGITIKSGAPMPWWRSQSPPRFVCSPKFFLQFHYSWPCLASLRNVCQVVECYYSTFPNARLELIWPCLASLRNVCRVVECYYPTFLNARLELNECFTFLLSSVV